MSGGSHGYIGQCWDMFDVLEKLRYLPGVAQRLREMGHDQAAAETQGLYDRLTAEPDHFVKLVAVWKSIDYRDSCDWGDDSVTEAIRAWEEARTKVSKSG